MNTDDLIEALVRDSSGVRWPIGRRLVLGAVLGAAVSTVLLVATLGIRPGLVTALTASWQLPLKFGVVLTLAASALAATSAACRPEGRPLSAYLPLVAVPCILLAGVAFELASAPAASWVAGLRGANPGMCLFAIPALAILPLAAMLTAMREAAPRSPALAGLAAGLAAAGVAASVYALRCTDDSPLFVAVWYLLAAVLVTAAGGAVGGRLLRW